MLVLADQAPNWFFSSLLPPIVRMLRVKDGPTVPEAQSAFSPGFRSDSFSLGCQVGNPGDVPTAVGASQITASLGPLGLTHSSSCTPSSPLSRGAQNCPSPNDGNSRIWGWARLERRGSHVVEGDLAQLCTGVWEKVTSRWLYFLENIFLCLILSSVLIVLWRFWGKACYWKPDLRANTWAVYVSIISISVLFWYNSKPPWLLLVI